MDFVNILLTKKFVDADINYIAEKLNGYIEGRYEIITPDTYDETGIIEKIDKADVLLGPYVTKKMMAAADNLKLIQNPWTGLDTFNFKEVQGFNVPICNSHSNADAVAEMGIGFIFDLLKKISYHDRKMRKGDWNRKRQSLDLSSEILKNKKVCILGYGSIGKSISGYLSGFGTEIVGVVNKRSIEDVNIKIYEKEDMMAAVKDADICIIALPLTHKTRNLINNETIKKFKRGCYIINLSRADIINEKALYEALDKGYVKGYASDVWWDENKYTADNGKEKENPFAGFDNVLLSPHRAGFLKDTFPHLDDAILNIINLINDRPLINRVDTEEEY